MANISSIVVERSINNPKFGVQIQLSLKENSKTQYFDSLIALVEHSTYNLKFEESCPTVTGTVERKMVKWVFWIMGSIGSTVVEQFTDNHKSEGSYPVTTGKIKNKINYKEYYESWSTSVAQWYNNSWLIILSFWVQI